MTHGILLRRDVWVSEELEVEVPFKGETWECTWVPEKEEAEEEGLVLVSVEMLE